MDKAKYRILWTSKITGSAGAGTGLLTLKEVKQTIKWLKTNRGKHFAYTYELVSGDPEEEHEQDDCAHEYTDDLELCDFSIPFVEIKTDLTVPIKIDKLQKD